MSSNGNIFRLTGHLCGQFTGPRWIPHKGQWRGALMFSLICTRINCWVNNGEVGDLRRHRAYYDVIVMCWPSNRRSRDISNNSFDLVCLEYFLAPAPEGLIFRCCKDSGRFFWSLQIMSNRQLLFRISEEYVEYIVIKPMPVDGKVLLRARTNTVLVITNFVSVYVGIS